MHVGKYTVFLFNHKLRYLELHTFKVAGYKFSKSVVKFTYVPYKKTIVLLQKKISSKDIMETTFKYEKKIPFAKNCITFN